MGNMFCYQCQETKDNIGCKIKGVCGKSADLSNMQDLLIWNTKGLSQITTRLRDENKIIDKEVNNIIITNLFSTITNSNFDDEDIKSRILKTLNYKKKLIDKLDNRNELHDAAKWNEEDESLWNDKSKYIGVMSIQDEDERSLKELITYGLKGLSAYTNHANVLLEEDERIDIFIQKTLSDILKEEISLEELIDITLKTGEYGVLGMSLLDKANTKNYGHPEITNVDIGTRDKPGILVSGHDLKDLEMLLKQTEGKGIDIYTHSEMLPAHYYPEFKKYEHFVGNYGNAWWKQREEFESFNGPILMTTNCIINVKDSYRDRIYTTGVTKYPDIKHIEGKIGEEKDFSEIIKQAESSKPPKEIEKGKIIGGFAHNQVISLADDIVKFVKNGDIENFVVMAGCDGRHKERDYYTEFAKSLPEKSIILTAGCAKYKYNKLDLGDINGIPRVLDAGQCNDSYSLVLIAKKLQEAFGLEDINDLPIIYNISWYEQKAVIVLLSLLYLGVKEIHLGPTLPAFLSSNVIDILVDNFGISGISDVNSDIEKFFG